MKTSSVCVATLSCSVLFSAWLFDHSPTSALVQSAAIVAVLLVLLSLLITYALHIHRKYDSAQAMQYRRDALMAQQYPHVAEFNRRVDLLHKQSTSGKVKS